MKGIKLKELQLHRGETQVSDSVGLNFILLNQLSTKWESRIDPAADFRLFLMMNKSGSLISSATSRG